MQAIAEMGEAGLQEMATMLAAPGKGDNTALEYALNGFSYYTTKPGKEALKKWSESAYIHALEKTSDKENKAFIIRQIQTTGSDAAVASLKNYLSDERLCDPAARALVKINTATAGKVLLAALTAASGDTRLTLIESLGDIRYREAAPAIAAYTTSDDKKLAKLALYALASIAETRIRGRIGECCREKQLQLRNNGCQRRLFKVRRTVSRDGKNVAGKKDSNHFAEENTCRQPGPGTDGCIKTIDFN
ncbi:MAG: HEAT repeat domain-containing protein [Bacteroidota bacterium]